MKMTRKKEIEELLAEALLRGGEMAYALYKYDMEEHIDDLYDGLKKDGEEFVFAVNENTGDVTMVLITVDKTLYINERAREKLQEMWPETYRANIIHLLPMMVDDLASGIISVTGVKITRT